jgi:hypothetical protein
MVHLPSLTKDGYGKLPNISIWPVVGVRSEIVLSGRPGHTNGAYRLNLAILQFTCVLETERAACTL